MEPGLIVLLGSGEASPNIRSVYHWVFEQLSLPIKTAILETPAGFEPNSDQVAGQIGDYLKKRLQNFNPSVSIIPARKRGTEFSPDNPALMTPLYQANVILTGPGSPTYAVRQFQDSLAWHTLCARHRMGATLFFSSATTVASGAYTLPVYEIYKVGEDLHWKPGLNFFSPFGLSPVIIPHWNNTDGGANLDTSRCYIGQNRFEQLRTMLPVDQLYIGIDENTALIFNPKQACCHVMGAGGVTITCGQEQTYFEPNATFPIQTLSRFQLPEISAGIPADIWTQTREAVDAAQAAQSLSKEPDAEILRLVDLRGEARQNKNWAEADRLRDEIAALGWQIKDGPEGAILDFVPETGGR
ncbi:MAG: cysteinyl-tRNA synthetase [Chloroflexota bacterium]